MITSLKLICLIIAIVLAFIAAFWQYWTGAPRVNVLAAAVFFYALKDLFGPE
jgi:hypothetical protein